MCDSCEYSSPVRRPLFTQPQCIKCIMVVQDWSLRYTFAADSVLTQLCKFPNSFVRKSEHANALDAEPKTPQDTPIYFSVPLR